ncbi:acetylcholinesterase-like [Planococcus citri]|uniref:acetylcholinesterase-like n=1 Tax=Planococcus citri TaxID=170843 RepID=UPI0031F81DE9
MYKCLVILFLALCAEGIILTTNQGTINGTYLTTRRGKLFNAFYGIPFAQPPLGELRFKPPKEAKSWSGVLDASVVPNSCLQVGLGADFNSTVGGSEDCLNLNVYTPLNARKGDGIAVVVYLFGGMFKGMTNMDFGPQYILDRDVILVEPNYRLGALGFMSTGDSVISGNYQLKDQTMALKWIQKNIHHFGGDPNSVTLQGHSSSTNCIHLHTVSPLSRGLFHKVIMQSGIQMDRFFGPDVLRGIVKEFATKAGCPDITSSERMHSCLMTLDAEKFPVIEQTMYVWDLSPGSVFKPSIESEDSEEPFITKPPSTADYHTPNMPWIIGLTTGEASFKVAHYLSDDGELASEIDQYYKLLFPVTLLYLWDTKIKQMNYISQTLRSYYFGDRKIGNETCHQMTEFYTHGMFGVSIIKAIRNYPGPKYVYWYDYKSNHSRQNIDGYYEEYLGVSHGEDVDLLFYRSGSDAALTETDHMFSEELVKRWVNFVKTGNPNFPNKINADFMGFWEPMITNRIEYLRINWNGTMETDLYKGIYEFWASLPFENKYEGWF